MEYVSPPASQLMKTLKQFLSVTALFASLALTSSAAPIFWQDRDPDSGNGPLAYLSENGNASYRSDFDILAAGFNPLEHVITKIVVRFAFADDANDGSEKVDIVVGNQKLWNDQEVDGNHNNAPNNYHWLTMDVTGNQSIFDQLSEYGKIAYKVTVQNLLTARKSDKEDTWLKIAHLKVWGETKPQEVPDAGTTIALLGLGLLGLAAARKRLA